MKNGRLYRYYVAQRVLKGVAGTDDGLVWRVSAAEIEAAVVHQVRTLLRQPEVVVGPAEADIHLRVEGLAGLVRDLGAIAPEALRAAA